MTRKIYDFHAQDWKTPEAYAAKRTAQQKKAQSDFPCPQIMKPMPEYKSIVSGKQITTRKERMEDLKQHNCRELDPSEYTPKYQKPKNRKRQIQKRKTHG